MGGKLSGAWSWHWAWGIEEEEGEDVGWLSSQNREGSAVNHINCLAPTWKEKKRRSVGFAWGFTCCIGYQMDLETKCLLERTIRDKIVKPTLTLTFTTSRLRLKGR